MTHLDLLWALVWIGLALLCGKGLRRLVPALEDLFLPSSILGGLAVLLAGPQVLGLLARSLLPESAFLSEGLIPPTVIAVWRGLPGLLINIVFAALLLGRPLPGPREIWRRAGPQTAFGQSIAWGQYVVGIGLGMLVLTPWFGLPPQAGALIEIAFEGGHGTAAGMAETFHALGFADGADLALALATVGLVGGVLIGTFLVNWAGRRGLLPSSSSRPAAARHRAHDTGLDADETEAMRDALWEKEQGLKPTDPLSIHLAVVGLAIAMGWIMRAALIGIETHTWGRRGVGIIRHVPLFPLAMLGGVLVQVILDRTGLSRHVSRRMMNRISGAALDFTIVAALGTLSLAAIRAHWAPFILLAGTGLAWNVFAVFVIAPRVMPEDWFPRAVCDFGQSTGVTVTGLLLLRMADPANRSGTLESFGYKQLLFEPIVGGGLFTAASMPLLVQFGAPVMLGITAALLAFWLVFGWLAFGRAGRR